MTRKLALDPWPSASIRDPSDPCASVTRDRRTPRVLVQDLNRGYRSRCLGTSERYDGTTDHQNPQ
jgi:hypothetical protein